MRTSGILTIGGAFVAILGSAFALLMLRAFFIDKGQGFVDLSGVVVGGVVAAIGLGLVAAGRKRARMGQLTGRGLFDLDFDASGQMVWKLSPDAGRAQLAETAGRSG